MTLSVIIVSYRTPEETLAAVKSSLASGPDQVILVDNASGDETIPALRRLADERLVLLGRQANEGFGTAANSGVRNSTGDVLIFLNSDATLDGRAVDGLLAELERWNGCAIVGPGLVGSDGVIQRSAGLLPAPSDLSIRALGLHVIARKLVELPVMGSLISRSRFAREYASAEMAAETIDTSMVSGACFAIGREAFLKLGGFDERFFMYFEDADLCRRAAAASMPIRYVPSAVVPHIGGASTSEDYHFGPMHARSMRQYLSKWYGPGGATLAVVLLWLRAAGLSILLRPGARRAWRALWAALRDEDPRR